MAQEPHHRVAVLATLLTAFLAGGTGLATGAAAAPHDPSPPPAATRAPDDGRGDGARAGKSDDRSDDRSDDKGDENGRAKDGGEAQSPAPSASPSPADHEEQVAPFIGPTAPGKPGKHARKTAEKAAVPVRAQGETRGQPVLAPVPPVPVTTRPPAAQPAGPPSAATAVQGPFLRTARPVRPLTRPVAAVRPGLPLWRVHEPVDRPLLRGVRAVAGDPTTLLLIAGLVGLFLAVQHRIDRNDPKLSRGHRDDPPDLRFGPPRRLRTAL